MIRRVALLAAILAALAVLLIGAGWVLIKPRELIALAQREIEARTGTELSYSGSPQVTLWPKAMVSLAEPVLTAPGAKGPPVLKARTLRLRSSLGDLVSGDLKDVSLVLEDARLDLRIDGEGKPNWLGSATGAKARLPIHLEIAGGAFAYLDERDGTVFNASEIDATLAPDGQEGVSFKAALVLNRQFARLRGELKSLARLAEDGSPLSFQADGPALAASFDGRLAVKRGFNLAGEFSAKTEDMGALAAWTGMPAPRGGGAASLVAALDASPSSITLKQARIEAAGNSILGDVVIGRGKARPHVTAVLEAGTADLAPVLALLAPAAGEALDFSGLKAFDGSLDFTAASYAIGGAAIGQGKANLSLTQGVLDIRAAGLKLFGGEAALQLVFDGSQDLPAVLIALNGRGLNATALLAALGSSAVTGTLAAELSIAGSGRTAEELLASLKGKGNLSVSGGQINGADLTALTQAAGRAIIDGVLKDADAVTPLTSASAACKVLDGIAFCGEVTLKTPEIEATGQGEVDFPRRDLAFTFAAELRGKALPAKLNLKGPWTGLRVYPDVSGILDNPEEAFAALKKLDWPETSTP